MCDFIGTMSSDMRPKFNHTAISHLLNHPHGPDMIALDVRWCQIITGKPIIQNDMLSCHYALAHKFIADYAATKDAPD
jgi:hypothetical protein